MTPAVVDVVIVSAGGFGRTIAGIARGDPDHGKIWQLVGFLDSREELAAKAPLALLGDPLTYSPLPGQEFICALGKPAQRRKFSAPLIAQGARFMNLATRIDRGDGLQLGMGCIFEPDVKTGVDVEISDFVLVQSNSIVGYEVSIGAYSAIGSFVFIGGRAKIGSDVIIHPHATILPGVKIGDGAIIGAGSVVIGNVPAGITVMGNPAKRLRF